MNKLKSIKELNDICLKLKEQNKKTVLITGCFDIIHYQHVEHINEARKYGGVIIGLESDENISLRKGSERPIFNFESRCKVLSSLSSVAYIFKIDGCPKENEKRTGFYDSIIKDVNPDMLLVNIKSDNHWEAKKISAKKSNVKFIGCITKQDISSSLIIDKLLDS